MASVTNPNGAGPSVKLGRNRVKTGLAGLDPDYCGGAYAVAPAGISGSEMICKGPGGIGQASVCWPSPNIETSERSMVSWVVYFVHRNAQVPTNHSILYDEGVSLETNEPDMTAQASARRREHSAGREAACQPKNHRLTSVTCSNNDTEDLWQILQVDIMGRRATNVGPESEIGHKTYY